MPLTGQIVKAGAIALQFLHLNLLSAWLQHVIIQIQLSESSEGTLHSVHGPGTWTP
jgi:hypothetical protein